MEMAVFLAVLCLTSASLGTTSVPFKRGRCAVISVRQKRPTNSYLVTYCTVYLCSQKHYHVVIYIVCSICCYEF